MFRIAVSNLSPEVTGPDLAALFGRVARVTGASVAIDKATGASRGIGFVTFTSADDTERGLGLNGSELGGRVIRAGLALDATFMTDDEDS